MAIVSKTVALLLYCPQVEFLKQLAEHEDLAEVLQKLGSIAAEILDCGSLR